MIERDYEDELLELEASLEDEAEGDEFLGGLLGGLGQALGGMVGEEEGELEGDWEAAPDEEAEAEVLMEVLIDQLAGADPEQADQFLPLLAGLAPLAVKAAGALAPVAARTAARVVPQLARGVVQLGRRMLRSPAGRRAIRTLPTIARGAARQVLRNVAAGRPVTGQTVGRAVAGQVANVLRDPRRRAACIERSRRIARAAKARLRTAAAR